MKISIIVPVYNVEKYLSKCLDSLINQNFSDYEIILVNDSSPDNSQQIIDKYKKKYSKIISSYIKENKGQGSARNLGVSKAKGKYICFVDSDDYVEPNFLEESYSYIIKYDLDILVFDIKKEYENTDNTALVKGMQRVNDNIQKDYIISEPGPCNKIFRRDIWTKNNLSFPENIIYEDLAFIPTIAKYTKKIKYVEKSYYNYLIHNSSTMNQDNYNEKLNDIFKSMDYLDKSLHNDFYEELEYLYIKHLLHGAGLRFLKYDEALQNIDKIVSIIKNKFPKWIKNKYFREESFKYRLVCKLLYKRKYRLLRRLLNEK